jgi:hypothetical protein
MQILNSNYYLIPLGIIVDKLPGGACRLVLSIMYSIYARYETAE